MDIYYYAIAYKENSNGEKTSTRYSNVSASSFLEAFELAHKRAEEEAQKYNEKILRVEVGVHSEIANHIPTPHKMKTTEKLEKLKAEITTIRNSNVGISRFSDIAISALIIDIEADVKNYENDVEAISRLSEVWGDDSDGAYKNQYLISDARRKIQPFIDWCANKGESDIKLFIYMEKYLEEWNGESDELTVEDYKEVIEDHKKLVRELDVLINGRNAAVQASLCDIVSQMKTDAEMSDADIKDFADRSVITPEWEENIYLRGMHHGIIQGASWIRWLYYHISKITSPIKPISEDEIKEKATAFAKESESLGYSYSTSYDIFKMAIHWMDGKNQESDLEKLFIAHQEFAAKRFPNSTWESSLIGLEREIREVRDARNDYCVIDGESNRKILGIEYVDCFMYLLDSMSRLGFTVADLKNLFKEKFDINENRDWKQNPDGSYSHI